MKTVIGIDNGTQSTKVIFYDYENMKIAAEASSPHNLISGEDGTKEQKAGWWIDALKKCFREIPGNIKKSAAAVGVSGQQHGFVPLDADGTVLHNVKIWSDTSTVPECLEIEAAYGSGEKVLREAGNRILPGYTASKILWFRKHHPEKYAKMRHILLPHDYLNFYLTGEYSMEYGDASGTGLLNIRERTWNRKMIQILDPDRDLTACLPKLLDASGAAGSVSRKAAEELGIPEGIIVSSGGGDNMMGAIGTGTVSPGIVTMSLGTSGTIYGYSDTPVIDETENLAAFCSSTGGWLPLLCTMNCTVGTELTRNLFDTGVKDFDETAGKARPGSGGILTIPFFTGERTPNLPKGKGCIVGITDTNMTKANIFRSTMEAAVFSMRLGLETFKELGFEPKEIRLIGGGANSPLWRQIASDILNLPVVVPLYKEAAALGAAVQALWVLQQKERNAIQPLVNLTGLHVKLDKESRCTPNSGAVKTYDGSYRLYRAYIDQLSPLYR